MKRVLHKCINDNQSVFYMEDRFKCTLEEKKNYEEEQLDDTKFMNKTME